MRSTLPAGPPAPALPGGPPILAGERLLPVPEALIPLLPDAGLRRGAVVGVGGESSVALSLGLALISRASAQGAWCGLVGHRSVGFAAAAEIGVALDRLTVVASPPPDGARGWAWVVATLLEGLELVVACPPARFDAADARRLRARVRRRAAVLVIPGAWPDTVDLRLDVVKSEWEGVGAGHGRLHRRRLEVRSGGRAWAGRKPRISLWLPAAGGGLALAADPAAGPASAETAWRHAG